MSPTGDINLGVNIAQHSLHQQFTPIRISKYERLALPLQTLQV
ncbi:MAG: hypothetical protein ACTJH9_09270 [Pseudoalteromonas sp.]